jgi:26S proteasome non-ATPase regulatory subunit 9
MDEFKALDKQRAVIEAEMQLIVEELCTGGGAPGLKGSLVDSEGFPRADIDVYNVRHKRHRFACLQTDLKEVTMKIEHVMSRYET